MSKYVIIGNSVAAISAAKSIRSEDKEGSITIIGDEKYDAYSRPMIPKLLSGELKDKKKTESESELYQ